jgi:hypothetical protein
MTVTMQSERSGGDSIETEGELQEKKSYTGRKGSGHHVGRRELLALSSTPPEEERDKVDEHESDDAKEASGGTHRSELAVARGNEAERRDDHRQKTERSLAGVRAVDLLLKLLRRRRALLASLLDGLNLLVRELDVGRGEVAAETLPVRGRRDDDRLLAVDPGDCTPNEIASQQEAQQRSSLSG